MGLLPHAEIIALHTTVISAGLAGSRDALLVGLPPELVASIRREKSDTQQILIDLEALNARNALPSDTPPLATWLANAVALAGSLQQAKDFEAALVKVNREEKRVLIPPPPAQSPGKIFAAVASALAVAAAIGLWAMRGGRDGTGAPATATPSTGGLLRLAVRAETIAEGVTSPIGRCDVLHTDDRLALYLRVDRPAHVCVLYLTATGEVAQLYPEHGDDGGVLAPNVETRLPTFKVVDPPGEENIYVVASAGPLEGADRTLDGLFSDLRAAVAVRYRTATRACGPPSPAASSPPRSASGQATTSKTKERPPFPLLPRGIVRSHDERTKLSQIDGDAEGIAVHHLPLQHLPR